MFIYIPFLCVTLGAVISWRGLPPRVLRVSDMIMNTALMLLMTVIGLNIGLSETVMKNLGRIGIKCLLISLAAIACSVALTALCERTVMPLEKIRLALLREKQEVARQNRDAGRGALPRAENAGSKQEDATGECGNTKGGIAHQASRLPENAQTEDAQGGSFSPLLILMPLFILLIGLIYLVEVLSVMIQVTYFKATHGKRIFKMAPIHHHFELCGWSETRVVAVFSVITAVMCLIALLAL